MFFLVHAQVQEQVPLQHFCSQLCWHHLYLEKLRLVWFGVCYYVKTAVPVLTLSQQNHTIAAVIPVQLSFLHLFNRRLHLGCW